jgi:hypothetical protein
MADLAADLAARNWPAADQAIRDLPEIPLSIHPQPHSELVPVFRLYARGEWKQARRVAAAMVMQGRETATAAALALLVNRRLRDESLPPGLAASAGVYLALLIGSLYFGLRRSWRAAAAH